MLSNILLCEAMQLPLLDEVIENKDTFKEEKKNKIMIIIDDFQNMQRHFKSGAFILLLVLC